MGLITELKRKFDRKRYLVECGANITEFKMNPKDVFVYEKEDVTGKIVKMTNNEPQIGSILQLDYNPRIQIYKHIHDKSLGLDFWYCRYISNNGRDAIVNY